MFNRRSFIQSSFVTAAATSVPGLAAAYTLPEAHLPREVYLKTKLPAGEIHLDPGKYALYWTLPDNKAIRYTVGIGRPGLYEAGVFYVGAKKEWPSWTPTPAMIKRDPGAYARYAGGMPGGENNPLGARALYLFVEGRGDTYLRIHGTNKPETLGTSVSNGCARLTNEHIVELYNRVPMGTKITLYPQIPA